MAIFFFLLLLLFAGVGAGRYECREARCAYLGPTIRFPFRLKGIQPPHCGFPGFDVSCTQGNKIELELQVPVNASIKGIDFAFSGKAVVKEIDYESQFVLISHLHGCLRPEVPNQNKYVYPFFFDSQGVSNYSLFNCSSTSPIDYFRQMPVNCFSRPGYRVFVFNSDVPLSHVDLRSCQNMYSISSPDPFIYAMDSWDYNPYYKMRWSNPICGNCTAEGKYCRLKNDSRNHETECFTYPNHKQTPTTVALRFVFLLVLLLVALYCIIRLNIVKKEDERKIEKFLEDYRAHQPTRYSFADINKITNHFRDKIGQGSYGTVYKGKLSSDIFVAVKLLNNSKEKGEEFINEVGTMGRIHHVNVVRLVGYCADGFKRALVYDFMPNDSLEKFVSSKNMNRSLGWEKLQHIALGIAKGIEYLHQGCDHRILHFDIKPHNILLDHNLNPKISDFGEAKLCSKEQSIVSMTAARGTIGYIAPEMFSRNFGNVSYKSDVYSYGMLLLEMVGVSRNINVGAENNNQAYFPEWIYHQLEQGEALGIQIEEEDNNMIAKKLAIVGLWCIQWYPIDRPSMKVVIQMLEGKGSPILPTNPFGSTNSTNKIATTSRRPFNSELEVISESDSDHLLSST